MYTFIILAQETSGRKTLVFAVKEKNESDAEGRIVKYLQNNVQEKGESYSVRTRYSIADTNHVQLLEINSRS